MQTTDGRAQAIDVTLGRDRPPLLLNRVNCVGTESNISQCPVDNNHICINDGGGVICPLFNGNYFNNLCNMFANI